MDQAGKSNLTTWKVGRKLGHKYTSYHTVPRHVRHFKKTDCFACCCFSFFPTTGHKLLTIIFILSLCISKKAMAPSQLHKPKKPKCEDSKVLTFYPSFFGSDLSQAKQTVKRNSSLHTLAWLLHQTNRLFCYESRR